jgi:hypothetical protein
MPIDLDAIEKAARLALAVDAESKAAGNKGMPMQMPPADVLELVEQVRDRDHIKAHRDALLAAFEKWERGPVAPYGSLPPFIQVASDELKRAIKAAKEAK